MVFTRKMVEKPGVSPTKSDSGKNGVAKTNSAGDSKAVEETKIVESTQNFKVKAEESCADATMDESMETALNTSSADEKASKITENDVDEDMCPDFDLEKCDLIEEKAKRLTVLIVGKITYADMGLEEIRMAMSKSLRSELVLFDTKYSNGQGFLILYYPHGWLSYMFVDRLRQYAVPSARGGQHSYQCWLTDKETAHKIIHHPDTSLAQINKKLEAVEDIDPTWRTVFVRGFTQNETNESLAKVFAEASYLIVPKVFHTGKNRGYLYLEFEEEGRLDELVEKYNGMKLSDRVVKVRKFGSNPGTTTDIVLKRAMEFKRLCLLPDIHKPKRMVDDIEYLKKLIEQKEKNQQKKRNRKIQKTGNSGVTNVSQTTGAEKQTPIKSDHSVSEEPKKEAVPPAKSTPKKVIASSPAKATITATPLKTPTLTVKKEEPKKPENSPIIPQQSAKVKDEKKVINKQTPAKPTPNNSQSKAKPAITTPTFKRTNSIVRSQPNNRRREQQRDRWNPRQQNRPTPQPVQRSYGGSRTTMMTNYNDSGTPMNRQAYGVGNTGMRGSPWLKEMAPAETQNVASNPIVNASQVLMQAVSQLQGLANYSGTNMVQGNNSSPSLLDSIRSPSNMDQQMNWQSMQDDKLAIKRRFDSFDDGDYQYRKMGRFDDDKTGSDFRGHRDVRQMGYSDLRQSTSGLNTSPSMYSRRQEPMTSSRGWGGISGSGTSSSGTDRMGPNMGGLSKEMLNLYMQTKASSLSSQNQDNGVWNLRKMNNISYPDY